MNKGIVGAVRQPRESRSSSFSRGRALACCLLALSALTGCPGSSSSGGGGLAVSPGALTFTAGEQDVLPASQPITLTVSNKDAAYVGAGYVGTQPSWLNIDLTGSGNVWTLRVSITSTSLAPGAYHALLRVGIANANQDVLTTQEVRVDYTVTSRLRGTPASLAFSGFEAGPATAPQPLTVGASQGVAWTASASAAWLRLGTTGGTGSGSIQVSAAPGQLAPGDYTGTVTLRAAGLPDATVSASLHVEATALTVEPVLTFSGTNGAALPAQTLHVAMNNGAAVAWTAQASPPWIVLGKTSGTTPDTVTVGVDASRGPLASGTHAGTITVSGSAGGQTLTRTVNVGLTLTRPVLSLQPSSIALGGPLGHDLQAKDVALSLDTGAVGFGWTASSAQGWVAAGPTSGTVSATPSTLAVGPDVTGLAGGSYAGALDFTVTVNGDVVTASLPVTLDLDERRLVVSDTGVAFAKTPSLSSLTRTLKVRDSFGLAAGWTAAPSDPWLAVTGSGSTPGDLVLTVDPAGLATDTVHLASVTVSPTGGGSPETIQVGVWVGHADPAPATQLQVSTTGVITDPIRPYAYAHAGGTDITIYNVFTTQVVGTIPGVAAGLGGMAVSLDGATLWAVDRVNFRIVPVDLATRTVGTAFPVGAAVGPEIHYTRTNGKGLILAGNRCIYDAATGAVRYPASGCTSTSAYAVSSSLVGNIFSIDSTSYRLDYSAMGGGTVLVGAPLSASVTAWNTCDYAYSPDGTRMYLAVKAPYDFYVVDTTGAGPFPQIQVLPGEAYPNNIEVARDGRIFGAIYGYANAAGEDAWVFAPDGTTLKAFGLSYFGIADRSLKISGDGLRMVTLPQRSSLPSAIAFHTTVP